MKNGIFIFIFIFILIHGTIFGQKIESQWVDGNICPADNWFLIMSDEFNDNSIDTGKWATYIPGGSGYSDACFECRLINPSSMVVFKDENVVESDTTLKILTKKENASWYGVNREYTSGTIYAKGHNRYTTFQRWEARIKLSRDAGFWPAFWAFGFHNEIDFFEYYPSDDLYTFYTHSWDIPIINNVPRASETTGKKYDLNLTEDWHIYAAEYDPFYIRFYIDGILMHTFAKLNILPNRPVSGCTIAQGTYRVSPAYPFDGAPMATILGNNIHDVNQVNEDLLPNTMEIDYVRIYSRGCPWSNPKSEITSDAIWDSYPFLGYTYNTKGIDIAAGKTLTIKNCLISVDEFGSITLGPGAKLILDNSSITACDQNMQWKGIIASENSVIEMKNQSIVERATTGISLGDTPMNGQDPSSIVNNPILKMESNSIIRLCDVGIYFGAGKTSSYIKNGVNFEDNKIAIVTESSTGLVIDGTTFTNNTLGIRNVDSYMHVRDDNSFYGGEYGIIAEGTYPGASGIQVGNTNPAYSTLFSGQSQGGIDCYGLEHPAGAYVVNCRFSDMEWSGAVFGGSNRVLFQNNTVENSLFGIMSEACGDNFNSTLCNVFDEVDGFDIHYAYENNNSQFIGNQAIGLNNTNAILIDAEIALNVGSAANPAGNCFSSADDIVTLGSKKFNYHYYNNNNDPSTICQNPTHAGNYTKVLSNNPPNNCNSGVGVFNLIDPDGDGVKGFVSSTSGVTTAYSGHINKTQISSSIADMITKVMLVGGDDPRTLGDETVDSSTVLFEKEAILDQWIRYAILRGMDSEDYAFVESVLYPLKKTKWQRQLFGIQIQQAKYSAADSLLATLPGRNTDEIYFKNVQAINLKRLNGMRQGQDITQSDVKLLEDIAREHEPSSAYARSIYHLLTGELIRYTPNLISPEMRKAGNENNETSIISDNTGKEDIQIYPNPTGSVLRIISLEVMERVVVLDMQGKIIQDKAPKSRSIELDLQGVLVGSYIIRVTDVNGKVGNYRTNKQ
jgi:beta-glucanase (GH16 family)